ncbi:signal recognition particle 68 kD protein, putative [Theileria equi strain WA]|uniref:Signal recognition particle subunit SRP68 n=1 Tax=Theileria equi strain WA TaxID=1537102 RepID=L0B1J5_THEEQ|nr:signal recognition particle 68 kD protein, putative [Theileria equi strain WA]AFZ81700.1 signal recognition particle 68 kD protein, putative [Theileria equi strain WA]|eukprot:XP_004831366.1 signal recognition particle 68 kD protein, putative [Theileria equi strain WA]
MDDSLGGSVVQSGKTPKQLDIQDPVEFTPITFPVLGYVNDIRFKHGIKFEEYGRFHKYCSKKLYVLRRQLRPSLSKTHRYIHEEFPQSIDDIRYLEILVVRSERLWSHGMDLKSKFQAASTTNTRGKQYYTRKFRKAYRVSMLLEDYCKKFGNNDTYNNAKIYRNYMEGMIQFEQEKFEEAHRCLSAYLTVLEQKSRYAQDPLDSEGYRSQISQINSIIKLCTFHLKIVGKTVLPRQAMQNDDSNADLITIRTLKDGDLALYCRGSFVQIESHLLLQRLLEALNSFDKLLISDKVIANLSSSNDILESIKSEITNKISKEMILNDYEEIMGQFTDCHNDVGSEIMTYINNQEQLRKLEVSILLLKFLLELEKLVVLEILSLNELGSCDTTSSFPNCNEGIRYANMLKQQVSSLIGNTHLGSNFLVPNEIVRSVNALLLGIYNFRQNSLNEGMALIHWIRKRPNMVDEIHQDKSNRILWRTLFLFKALQKTFFVVSNKFYKRSLVIFARNKSDKKTSGEGEYELMSVFNLEKNFVNCKPLLFDLAFINYNPPELATSTAFVKGMRNMFASLWS